MADPTAEEGVWLKGERRRDDIDLQQPSRPPTSTSKRRSTHYDQQSFQRSTTSGETSRSRRERTSYHEPFDYDHLNSVSSDPPVPESRLGRVYLEDNVDNDEDDYHQHQRSISRKSRHSYQGPVDYEDVSSSLADPPVQGDGERPQTEDRQSSQGPVRNFSRREAAARRRSGLQGPNAPPPVPQIVKTPASPEPRYGATEKDGHDFDEDESSDRAFTSRTVKEFLKRTDPSLLSVNSFWAQVYTVSYLIFFSFLGTLARLGVQWLTFYPGTPIVTPVVWANFGGCMIMGFLVEDKALFRDEWWLVNPSTSTSKTNAEKRMSRSSKRSTVSFDLDTLDETERASRKKAIPLFVGLATGFCGSFTSFSSFARDLFLALSNDLPTPIDHLTSGVTPNPSSTISRHDGYSFLAVLAVALTTVCLALAGLLFGTHLALALHPYTPKLPLRFIRRILDPSIPVLAFGAWLAAILLSIWPPHRDWRSDALFALVFAPVGCLARFLAGRHLNGLAPSFPLGTFAVNLFGAAVEALCYDLQHVPLAPTASPGGGVIPCQLLQGLQDGFCGCLTTVSTLAAELVALRRRHAYLYGAASLLAALALMVVIMGSVRWSIGWTEPLCTTGYPSKVHG
nr:fluoride export protein 1 [Quercus suber]